MWNHNSGGQKGCGLRHKMGSNPCLTFLLVYSATVSIALIFSSSLLATNHSTVVCKEVFVNHYTVVDASKDEIVEAQPEDTCKCHCNCKTEEMITGVEVFILTSVGILLLSLTVYSCIALRYYILKQKKQCRIG